MRRGVHEAIAVVFALGAIVLPLVLLSWPWSHGPLRVVSLTGVAKDGVWTDEVVTASNYAIKTFRRADVTLRRGEQVLLRLESADVTHGFYLPELGIGPVLVEPGHVVEATLTATRAGCFTYYCTTMCGHCHFFMQGTITVTDGDAPAAGAPAPMTCTAHLPGAGPAPPPTATSAELIERGAALFADKGCATCHGPRGTGGVKNPNYVKDTVPQNNLIAERMQIFSPEDAATVVDLIARGADLDAVSKDPPFRTYPRFLGQYKAVRALILNGNPAGKKDPNGPAPPLDMPSWRYLLSERDVDAVIAYLISEYPWTTAG